MADFDPGQSLADHIRIVENALIVPEGAGAPQGIARRGGVYDAEGRYVATSACLREPGLYSLIEPEGPPPEAEGDPIPGEWLYGGVLYAHFGHFLLESTARMWAPDALGRKMDGELFIPKQARVTWPNRFIRPMRPWLGLFGARRGGARARALIAPVRVERLVVAPQGIGLGGMVAGCPEYRDFVHRKLGAKIKAEGARKIYISRSRLFSKRGRYLGEARIEALMEAEGYRIFHPQEHSIEEQIAQYKAARRIVAGDGSALHLAAFFARPRNHLAIVLRRPGDTIDDYLLQYAQFAEVTPSVVDALSGQLYQFAGAKLSQMSEVYSEIDFPKLGRALAEGGFISRPGLWVQPPQSEFDAERADLAARLGLEIEAMDDD